MRVLRTTIKKRWFDMIAKLEKKEEYREIKDYWIKRLVGGNFELKEGDTAEELNSKTVFQKYDAIELINGYSANSPRIMIEFLGVDFGVGKKEWGGVPGVLVFRIKLGTIIHNN